MYCDHLVLLFLGLSGKDPKRGLNSDVGDPISQVLREVSKHCNSSPYTPHQPHEYHDDHIFGRNYHDAVDPMATRLVDDDSDKHYVPLKPSKYSKFPSRRTQILVNQYNELPVVRGSQDLVQILNTNQNIGMVRVPESVMLNLVTPNQLSQLYSSNQAVEVPSIDPDVPRFIAVGVRILSTILKAKKKFHNMIDHGVAGAENIFSSIHDAAGGIADIVGGGAHSILDLIG